MMTAAPCGILGTLATALISGASANESSQARKNRSRMSKKA